MLRADARAIFEMGGVTGPIMLTERSFCDLCLAKLDAMEYVFEGGEERRIAIDLGLSLRQRSCVSLA
jgi:hypothetical protein